MITVEEAEKIVLAQSRNYGSVHCSFHSALGRVLAEDLLADADIPAFDRVTMDGIAIRFAAFEKGVSTYKIIGTQAAGANRLQIDNDDECVEIMTGAVLPTGADTIVRYEDVVIENGVAIINTQIIHAGQNIHRRATDKRAGDIVAAKHARITPAVISIAAHIGATEMLVKALPKVVVISTGNELVDIGDHPSPYQLRRSNSYGIQAVLQHHGILPTIMHLRDDKNQMTQVLEHCLSTYDVIMLSGGVSMGKFDLVPSVLQSLAVKQLFHKVQQKPGKPFWFGTQDKGAVVFGFPGNPVSTSMCVHRYFIPWLNECLQLKNAALHAVLQEDVFFKPALTYFMPVKLSTSEEGILQAEPIEGNGSGDFTNLFYADAFMELPSGKENFTHGEAYRVWPITN